MLLIFAFMGICIALPTPEINTSDGQGARKILGSRVVTSVSVIMDGVNNTKTYFSDAVGKPVAKPATPTQLASPINLLNPDRYEFYTFDDSGDLVKRLMTLDEIQGIIASGDGEPANYYSQSLNGDTPEDRVDEVINNVQNVLKEEIQAHNPLANKPEINGPDVTSTWNLILPAIFGTAQNGVSDNALVPDTISLDTTTAKQQTETTSFNVVDYAKTESLTVTASERTTQQKTSERFTTVANTFAQTNPSTTKVDNEAQSIKTTTYIDDLSPNTLQSSTPITEQKETTLYVNQTSQPSTYKPILDTTEPSTIKPITKQKETTLYMDKTSPLGTTLPPTLKPITEQKGTTLYLDKTSSLSTTQPPSLKPITGQKETTLFIDKISSIGTTLSPTLKPITAEKETTLYMDKTSSLSTTQSITEQKEQVGETTTYIDKTLPSATDSTSTLKSITEQEQEVGQTTTYMDEISPSSTVQPSTLKLTTELKEEVKDTTAYAAMTPSSNIDASTIEPTLKQTERVEEVITHMDKTTSSTTVQPTLEQKQPVQETTAYVDVTLPASTLQLITLKWPIEQKEDVKETSTTVSETTEKIVTTTPIIKEETTNEPSTIAVEQTSVVAIRETTSSAWTPPNVPTSQAIVENEFKIGTTLQEKAPGDTTTEMLSNEYGVEFTTIGEQSQEEIEQSSSVSEENASTEDFPVYELLNLLSSVGSSSTTVSEVTTTMKITTPSQSTELVTENKHEVATVGVTTERVEENFETTALTEDVTAEPATSTAILDTTTDSKQLQTSLEIDKNMNEAVDSVIFQMINQEVSQTTIENLRTTAETEADYSTTSSFSLADVSDKNRYEEIDIENSEASSTVGYEAKTVQTLVEKLTTDNELLTTEGVPTTTDANDYTTFILPTNSTVPIKNLKTDSSESGYKKESTTTEKYVSTTNKLEETTPLPEVYYITDVSLRVDSSNASASVNVTQPLPITTTEFLTESEASTKQQPSTETFVTKPIAFTTTEALKSDINVTNELTTQDFVTIETVTSSSKLDKQPQSHVINRVSSTTPKPDTTWTLVSTVAPHKTTFSTESDKTSNSAVDLVPKPVQGFGLEDSTSSLEADVFQFTELCNELAFSFWNSVTSGISFARSVVVSPFATTSILAMVFLGARGATSGEMNDILKLDDMVTFNPHAVFKNVIESIEVSKKSGVAASVFVKELYSDKNKGKLLQFYKERVKQFYDGYVEEVNFKEINDIIRRRTNLLVKRQTWGKIPEYLKDNNLFIRPPLAAVTANIFQTDCSDASTTGRDGELHFVVLPSIRQRKLVPIPAVVYRSGFLAGYEPGLDATAVAIGNKDHTISTIFVIPGQQGISAPGDGLVRLETRLIESAFKQNAWSRLLRSLIPRPGLEVQIPRFSHKSVINATAALQRMGLKDVFNSRTADLKGLNGIAHELYLSDIIQTNTFATCGEGRVDETHHSEVYPATTNRSFRRIRKIQSYHQQLSANGDLSEEPRDYQRAFHDPLYDPTYLSLPLQFRPRQARLPDAPRLRFDRPFLYFVRHNPTGLILHMGRFNPRLLP